MTLGGDKGIVIGVGAPRADVGGVSLRYAGGLYGVVVEIVSQRICQNSAAGGAELGSLAGSGNALGMSGGIDGLLKVILTARTGIGAYTRLGTGGIQSNLGDMVVTQPFGQDLLADGADLILGTGGTGSSGVVGELAVAEGLVSDLSTGAGAIVKSGREAGGNGVQVRGIHNLKIKEMAGMNQENVVEEVVARSYRNSIPFIRGSLKQQSA
jgi:hypothetical protein